MKRICALLLALICLLTCLPGTVFAEQTHVETHFQSTVGNNTRSVNVAFDPDWFDAPSSTYNHKLAQLSIAMAMSAFRDTGVQLSESEHNIREFMRAVGFQGYTAYGYDQAPTATSISNIIAYRMESDDEGEYALIAVPICGQGYGNEWLSNFTVSNGEEHAGFVAAAQTVSSRLTDYIAENLPGIRVKVWVTGFSRAAAVSNLLGNLLLAGNDYVDDNIFVYTFGTPNNTNHPVAWPQIYNICGSFDPVPRIPIADWGYGKHGTTLYLPSRETDPDYAAQEAKAREVYASFTGSDTNFPALAERNWLITQVLYLMNTVMPNVKSYASTYQDAVIAAWNKKGSILDRLKALLTVLDEKGDDADNPGITKARNTLLRLTQLGVVGTITTLSGAEDGTVWMDLLTSGMQIAHEHFPEIYLAWMLSTDDPDDLFSQGSTYNRLIYTGWFETRVETQDGTVLYDTVNDIKTLSAVALEDETFLSLPAGTEYIITLSAYADSKCQLAFSPSDVSRVGQPLYTTHALTIYNTDTITVYVTADGTSRALLNGTTDLPFESSDSTSELMLAQDGAVSEVSDTLISNAVVIIAYLLLGISLALYSVVVLVKRIVRHKVQDLAPCRRSGMVLLIIAAAVSAFFAAFDLYTVVHMLITEEDVITVATTSRTMQRMAEFLGWGSMGYYASVIIVYAVMSVMCLRSIHHQFSRIRAVRLSLALLVINAGTLIMGQMMSTLTISDVITFLLPVLVLVGLNRAHIPTPGHEELGKRWIPLMRVVVLTALLFTARQVFMLLFTAHTLPAVAMKALIGLPTLGFALVLYGRRATPLHAMTAVGMLIYFMANTLINLSTPVGAALFVLGHAVMTWGFIRTKKPGLKHYIAFAVMAAVFILETFLVRRTLPGVMLFVGAVYAVSISALVVSASAVGRRVFVSALMMMIANQLLVITLLYPGSFALESLELLVYYVSIVTLVCDPSALPKPQTEEKNDVGENHVGETDILPDGDRGIGADHSAESDQHTR